MKLLLGKLLVIILAYKQPYFHRYAAKFWCSLCNFYHTFTANAVF